MSTLQVLDVVEERFKINGKWTVIEGTVVQIKKSKAVVIKFEEDKYQYSAKKSKQLALIRRGLKKSKKRTYPTEKCQKKKKQKKKPYWVYVDIETGNEFDNATTMSSKSPTPTSTSYNAALKANSSNKNMCRQAMLSGMPSSNLKKKALVLDAEDMQFSTLMVKEYGFLSSNIDVPNCNPQSMIDHMQGLGRANVHGCFLGDFLRSIGSGTRKYTTIFLDYCGMPGARNQINTPLHDIGELFQRNLVASNATIGMTVCLRNQSKTKILYQNMHQMSNAVTAAAFEHGFLATTKMQTNYKDKGSQTMCFVCFYLIKL